ncbi:hypothetical protein [Fibrella arboris]|uniref:hypothetical protein n=1 Tax=Fibrella arboris TaxID=3242486 RepID=UPI0035208DC9
MDSLSTQPFTELQAMLKYALEQQDIADEAGQSGLGLNWHTIVEKLRQAIADKFEAI